MGTYGQKAINMYTPKASQTLKKPSARRRKESEQTRSRFQVISSNGSLLTSDRGITEDYVTVKAGENDKIQ